MKILDFLPSDRHNESLWAVYCAYDGAWPFDTHISFYAIFVLRMDAENYVREFMEEHVGQHNEPLYTIVEV